MHDIFHELAHNPDFLKKVMDKSKWQAQIFDRMAANTRIVRKIIFLNFMNTFAQHIIYGLHPHTPEIQGP